MKGYAIGIPIVEMAIGIGNKTDTLIQAAKSNKNFVNAGFNRGLSTLIFKTKESTMAAFMVAQRLDFDVAIGEVEYDLRNPD